MRVVFLDIDGVLNHQIFFKKRYDEREHERKIIKEGGRLTEKSHLEFYAEMLDVESIEILNSILDKVEDVKFVISSTWRMGETIESLTNILSIKGFKGEIIGMTPIGCKCCVRGNEIQEWVSKNMDEEDAYVIFDDDSDMLWWQRNNFIHIDGYAGITPNSVYKAVRILKGVG